MSSGLYQDHIIVDRSQATVSATTLFPPYVAPTDFEVIGMIIHLGTAAGAGDGVIVNVSNSPTSQTGGGGSTVSAYNLWTTANAPTVTGTATLNWLATQSNVFYGAQDIVNNQPYALNYPLPGPSGTKGFVTAQSTSQTTQNPVVSPPVIYQFGMAALVAPDNTYTDYNGNLLVPASVVHAGDVLSFVITAGGTNVSLGAAANMTMTLVGLKR